MKKSLLNLFNFQYSVIFILFCTLFFLACTPPNEFSNIPNIKFNDIIFYDVASGSDSLVLLIDFTDGDGDLGLESYSSTAQFFSLDAIRPYHDFEVITDSQGRFVTVSSESISFPWYRVFPNERVNFSTSSEFGNVDNRPFFSCLDYEIGFFNPERTFFTSDRRILDQNNQSQIKFYSTLTNLSNITKTNLITDTVYVNRNKNRFNILVEYFVKRNGQYEVFDWLTVFDATGCLGVDYNGRFPILDLKNLNSKSSLEGTIKYKMLSAGFVISFRTDTIKLRIKIKDRALNDSNVIETPDFTLLSAAAD